MSKKTEQIKFMQAMFPNVKFVECKYIEEGQRVADDSITIDHIVDINKKVSLTEQWKRGELERGWYYVLLFSNEEYITFIDGNWVVDDRLIGADIKEVLAPVPSWEQWQSLNELLDSMRGTNKALAHRLNLCKDLLKECREVLKIAKYGSLNNLTNSRYGVEYLLPQIDKALK